MGCLGEPRREPRRTVVNTTTDCISASYIYLQVIADTETELHRMYMHYLSDDTLRSKMTPLE